MRKGISLSYKLVALGLAYTIPIVALLYLLVKEQNKSIDFAELEIVGTKYIQPLNHLFYHLSQHKMVAGLAVGGDKGAADKLSSYQTEIEKDLGELQAADATYGTVLQFTDEGLAKRKREHFRISIVRPEWNQLKSTAATMTLEASREKHDHLIADVRAMIQHACDTSNLTLDPDLDSYYDMDATITAIPDLMDRVQNSMAFIHDYAGKTKPSIDDKMQINTFDALLRSAIDHVTGSFGTALNEDPNFYGRNEWFQTNVPAPLADMSAGAEAYLTHVKNAWQGEPGDISTAATLSAGAKALDALNKLFDIGNGALVQLLNARIASFKSERSSALIWAALASFLAACLGTLIMVTLRRNFNRALKAFFEEAHATHLASSGLVEVAQNLSDSTAQQAAAIQESVSTMSEMSSLVAQTAKHVREAHSEAEEATAKTHHGKTVMQSMVNSMDSIRQSNAQLGELARIIDEISIKTDVINDIVFKTQLLSFNASIEAARAGQHGRGFAVVASEVGNLAQTSGKAATEIESLLQNSKQKVSQIVDEMQGKVTEGHSVSNQALEAFSDIAVHIKSVSEKVENINNATTQQETGITETSKAMSQMNSTTTGNSLIAKRTADTAHKLKSHSNGIRAIASMFESLIFGSARRTEADARDTHKQEGNAGLTQVIAMSSNGSPVEMSSDPATLIERLAHKPTNATGSGAEVSADDQTFRKIS